MCSFWDSIEKIGVEKGEKRLSALINCLISDGLENAISIVVSDASVRESYYQKYNL